MKINENFYQHGDVLIEKVCSIPEGLKKKKGNVLMDGEATGHQHTIHSLVKGLLCYKILYDAHQMYLKNEKEVEIRHQEHEAFILPPGTWKIGQVREIDHFENEIRRVID